MNGQLSCKLAMAWLQTADMQVRLHGKRVYSLKCQPQVAVGMPTVVVCAVGIALAIHWQELVNFGILAVPTCSWKVLVLPLVKLVYQDSPIHTKAYHQNPPNISCATR